MKQKGAVHTEKPAKRSKFLEEDTELDNNPEAVDQHTERKERERKNFSKRDRRFKAIAIKLVEDSKRKNRTKDTKGVVPCVMCAKSHNLEQCKAYLTKSVDDKKQVFIGKEIMLWKLISNTHTARNCNQRRSCKVCNKKHPTSLHGFKLKNKINQRAVNDTSG